MTVEQRSELFIDWRARAEKAEADNARLVQERDALASVIYEAHVRLESVIEPWDSQCAVARDIQSVIDDVLATSGLSLLAARDAQVERETLTTIGSLLGLKLCSCWEEIQQRFAPKGETDERD